MSSNSLSDKYKEALLAETREELQKADTKASILLAASGIVLGALVTALAAGTWTPSDLAHHDARWSALVAIIIAAFGLCFLEAAVMPRLRSREMAREQLHYFGNVQAYWPAWFRRRKRNALMTIARKQFDDDLRKAATDANYSSRLDDQIWFLGHIAFRKYRFVRNGMWLFALSIAIAVLTVILEKY